MTFKQTLEQKGVNTNKLSVLFCMQVKCSNCPFQKICHNTTDYCIDYVHNFLNGENYFNFSAQRILRFLRLYYFYVEDYNGMLNLKDVDYVPMIFENLLKERKDTK